jgi:DNA (cytosine-5)-methyltransferase 1
MVTQVLSVFTGAAGLDLGLESAGYEVRACVDIDESRCQTLRENRPDWAVINSDIRDITGTTLLRAGGMTKSDKFIVSGAAPCGAFSKAAFWVPHRFDRYRRDSRRTLPFEFARIVNQTSATGFVFENVASLAYSTNRRYLENFLRLTSKAGYAVSWKVVNCAAYGIPQKRERLFVVGIKGGQAFSFPEPTHQLIREEGKGLKRAVTAADAIGELDDGKVEPSEKPGGKYGGLLDQVPAGDNYLYFTGRRGYPKPLFGWRSRYWSFLAKLSPNQPSWTIPAHPSHYGGPFHWRSRRLRIPEVMRLQTFPRNWRLPAGYKRAWSALGDATPPLMSKIVGEALLNQLP